jgi:hypothetical protein
MAVVGIGFRERLELLYSQELSALNAARSAQNSCGKKNQRAEELKYSGHYDSN